MSIPRTEQSRWIRVLLIVVAIIVLAPLLMMMFMMPMMGLMWGSGGAPSAGTGMSPTWSLGIMLVFLVVVLGIGYALYRVVPQSALGSNDPALEELRLAYARGELSQEEFEQRRDDLRQSE